MSNALPVSRDTGYPGEWCRDKLTSDHSLGLQYCRGLALYLLTDCRRLLHGGWWSRDTCCCWRHFFGMVILMTFVATLAIYGIASRNFILVSPMDFLVIYPEMTCITRSSAVAKRPRDASCLYIASIQNVERSLLLLVVSASEYTTAYN